MEFQSQPIIKAADAVHYILEHGVSREKLNTSRLCTAIYLSQKHPGGLWSPVATANVPVVEEKGSFHLKEKSISKCAAFAKIIGAGGILLVENILEKSLAEYATSPDKVKETENIKTILRKEEIYIIDRILVKRFAKSGKICYFSYAEERKHFLDTEDRLVPALLNGRDIDPDWRFLSDRAKYDSCTPCHGGLCEVRFRVKGSPVTARWASNGHVVVFHCFRAEDIENKLRENLSSDFVMKAQTRSAGRRPGMQALTAAFYHKAQ